MMSHTFVSHADPFRKYRRVAIFGHRTNMTTSLERPNMSASMPKGAPQQRDSATLRSIFLITQNQKQIQAVRKGWEKPEDCIKYKTCNKTSRIIKKLQHQTVPDVNLIYAPQKDLHKHQNGRKPKTENSPYTSGLFVAMNKFKASTSLYMELPQRRLGVNIMSRQCLRMSLPIPKSNTIPLLSLDIEVTSTGDRHLATEIRPSSIKEHEVPSPGSYHIGFREHEVPRIRASIIIYWMKTHFSLFTSSTFLTTRLAWSNPHSSSNMKGIV